MSKTSSRAISTEMKVEEIMKEVSKAPIFYSDDDIAQILISEAKRSVERPTSSTEKIESRKIINKTYISNTIRSVSSHNRREEEADCWREYSLKRKVDDRLARRPSLYDREINCDVVHHNDDIREREEWAARKLLKTSITEKSIVSVESEFDKRTTTNVEGDKDEEFEIIKKRSKKKKNSEAERAKRKHKKKKQIKKAKDE